jgi:Fe-S-cluster formation regulator IscX/YfhJ
MGLKWTDALEVVSALDKAHPDMDPLRLRTEKAMWAVYSIS